MIHCLFIFLFTQIHFSKDIALSQVTLLLPTASSHYDTKHLLEATGGCAEWEVTNENVAELVKPTSDPCEGKYSKSMLVVPRWTQKIRKSTHIKATLQGDSNKWAECQVFVDQISSLEIHTSTKVVYIGEVEDLRVLAKDSRDNVFSTVSGLPFQWAYMGSKLQTLSLDEAKLNLEHYTDYSSSPTDHVPICGKATGQVPARVSLEGTDAAPGKVEATANLSVVVKLAISNEALILWPTCQTTVALFSIESNSHCRTFVNNVQKRIGMPHDDYEWSSNNEGVATVDKRTGVVTAVSMGEECEITVQDGNFEDNQISSSVYVREPKKIYLTLQMQGESDESRAQTNSKADTWYLTLGKKYEMTIDLQDARGKIFNMCDNVKFSVTTDSVESVSHQNIRRMRYVDLNTISTGKTLLTVVFQEGSVYVQAEMTLIVTDPIRVIPSEIILPYTGHASKHEAKFDVTGGSGMYDYELSNKAIAETRDFQRIMAKPKRGESELMVYDAKDRANSDSAMVYVIGDIDIQWRPGQRDVEVGGFLKLYLAIHASKRRQFTSTRVFEDLLTVSATQEGISMPRITWLDREKSPQQADFLVEFSGTSPGFKDVTARLKVLGGADPETTTKIQVYDDLTIVPSEVYMAEGSSVTLRWMGGPEKFGGVSVSSDVKESKGGKVRISALPDSKSYKVTCNVQHEQDLTVSVSTRQSDGREGNQVFKKVIIHCFPPLILKSPVELGVGQQYDIELPNWLQNSPEMLSMLNLRVNDESVSKLYAAGRELTGRRTGTTKLQAWIDHPSLRDLSEFENLLRTEVDIIVAFQDFRIAAPMTSYSSEQTMYEGEDIFVHVVGSNSEAPDSESFSEVEIKWRVEGGCVKLLPVFGPDDTNEHLSHYGIRVRGDQVGSCQLHANVKVAGGQVQAFNSMITIHVVDNIMCSCSSALLPPRAEIDMQQYMEFKQSMTYSLVGGSNSALEHQGQGVFTASSDSPRDEAVRIQSRSSDVQYVTVSVRDPAGVTFTQPSVKSFCVGESRTISVSLYDATGRNFQSLVGYSAETLSELLSIRIQDENVLNARRTSVFNRNDASLVAHVTLTANQVGTTIIHLGMPQTVPVYLTVRVQPFAACEASFLRGRVTIGPRSDFYKLCSDVASKMFTYEVAQMLDVPPSTVLVSEIDFSSSTVTVAIESSRDDDLLRAFERGYPRLVDKLGLSSSLPVMDWVTSVRSPPMNSCPADYSSSAPRRGAAASEDVDTGVWGWFWWILKNGALIFFFIFLFQRLYQWWTDRWAQFQRRQMADMNAEQGPNLRFMEYNSESSRSALGSNVNSPFYSDVGNPQAFYR